MPDCLQWIATACVLLHIVKVYLHVDHQSGWFHEVI